MLYIIKKTFQKAKNYFNKKNMFFIFKTSARHIFHTVHKNKLIKGRSNNAIIAACLFIACRQQSVPRTFKEISAVASNTTTIKDIGRCYKIIRKALVTNNTNASGISSASSTDLIERFCSKLILPKEVKKLADFILTRVNDVPNLTSRSPNSLAAAAIYMALELTQNSQLRTTEEIGRICGAAENTIKQTIKHMQPHAEKIVPPEMKSSLHLIFKKQMSSAIAASVAITSANQT
jgi:transcription initiation factor TFIIB